jgi:HD-GYP domain-containing protein (c-di-GMP phosphodiesterase class II)
MHDIVTFMAARGHRPVVRLAELLAALSKALDMTEGQPEGHCIRACWIGTRIAAEIGLTDEETSDLYYTVLLKDLGCSSNAARICELYLTDDLAFKHDFKRLDDNLPKILGFVIAQTGVRSGLAERFRAIVNIFRNGGTIARELIETRCQRGANIAGRMRFSTVVQDGIRSLDEHWNGGGKPEGLTGEAIPLGSRIALLAQIADVFATGYDRKAAMAEIAARSGTWLDPRLCTAFAAAASRTGFWETMARPDLSEHVLSFGPALREETVDDDYLDDIAEAFGQIVDSKSPYTSGHCERVTLFSDMIAESMGLSADRRRWLKRAALLHDIGKLGVSNSILDKPAKLDAEEWRIMRLHSMNSREILSRIAVFGELAEVAGAHHERLDGKGYPDGIGGDDIGLETRIVTVADIFDALTADRPYRKAMTISEAFAVMEKDVGTAIDPICFAALRGAVLKLEEAEATKVVSPLTREDGEVDLSEAAAA